MGKRIAVVQSNYIPWKGYFDLIRSVDEFVLLDDVQYTRRDWRNRNIIKTPDGPMWLTIPVKVKGKYSQPIREVETDGSSWREAHWRAISHNYARTPYFRDLRESFEQLYLGCRDTQLSHVNHRFLTVVCDLLGIRTRISWSMDYGLVDGKTERLVALCRQLDAAEYLSGPAARGYISEELFAQAGITLRYADYSGYPEYPQLHPPFNHFVSIIDLVFNVGADAIKYMKCL
jgi:hypothetical protein